MVVKVTILVKRDDCRVANAMSEANVNFNVVKVNIGANASRHLVILSGKSASEVASYLRGRRLYAYVINNNTLWVSGPSCSACRFMANLNTIVNGINPTGESVTYNVWLPSRGGAREVIKGLRRGGFSFKIVSISNIDSVDLTERQFEALTLAYKRGLFDAKRRVSIIKLSRELGVTPSTYSELLRKALKKVLDHYFNELP